MPFTDNQTSSWLGSGYTYASNKIQFDETMFPQLTAAEAAPSADIRRFMFAVVDGLYTKVRDKNFALAETARPDRMRASRSVTTSEETGLTTQRYTFTFTLNPPPAGSIEVADEPTV